MDPVQFDTCVRTVRVCVCLCSVNTTIGAYGKCGWGGQTGSFQNVRGGKVYTVRLEKLFLFCYRCTFLKQCDRLRSVPFYYRSPFRFFCRLCLNGAVSPPFLGTCKTYIRTTSIDVTPTRLTLAVGLLVSLLARWCCNA